MLDERLDLGEVGARHLAHHLAVENEVEGGDRADVEFRGGVFVLIDVDLDELYLGVLCSEVLYLRRNGLARATPGSRVVY